MTKKLADLKRRIDAGNLLTHADLNSWFDNFYSLLFGNDTLVRRILFMRSGYSLRFRTVTNMKLFLAGIRYPIK